MNPTNPHANLVRAAVKRLDDDLRAIRAAVKRLEASDTPAKRKNARKMARGAVGALESRLEREYPLLAKDGSAVRPTWISCPVCRVPIEGWNGMVRHLLTKHAVVRAGDRRGSGRLGRGGGPGRHTLVCPCGYTAFDAPISDARRLKAVSNMAAHLRAVSKGESKMLADHLTLHTIRDGPVAAGDF